MKTKILTVAALVALAVTTGTKSFANTTKEKLVNVSTTLTDVKNINKIEVRGNVQLYVSNGTEDNVKVYDRYYSQNALVQNQNGVLRIASYKAEKLVVWVTAADLRNISAYDNASVKSFGKLSGIELGVELHNHAAADLDVNAFDAKISVNDFATANLSGDVNKCDLQYSQSASVNSTKFVSNNITRTVSFDAFAKSEQLTGL